MKKICSVIMTVLLMSAFVSCSLEQVSENMQKFNKNFFYPKKADVVAVNQAKIEIVDVMSTENDIKSAVEKIINLGNESEADQEALVTALKEEPALSTPTDVLSGIDVSDLIGLPNGTSFTLTQALEDSNFENKVIGLVGKEIGPKMVAIVDELYHEITNDEPSMRDFLVASIIGDVFTDIERAAKNAGGDGIDKIALVGTLNTDIKVLQILTGLDEIGELYKSAAQLLNDME